MQPITDYKWIGMAHQFCIDNPIVVSNFLVGWFLVAVFYILFVQINNDIRKIKRQQGQADADQTFKWFTYVFYSCAITRVTSSITMFYGIYWLEAIFIWVNAIVIIICYFVYRSQKKLFIAKSLTEQDLIESQQTIIEEILNLDLDKDALEKVKELKK